MKNIEITNKILENLNTCIDSDGKMDLSKFIKLTKELEDKVLNLHGVVKSLKTETELAIDGWLKINNYTLTNDGYTRNGITFSFGEMHKRYNDYLKTL